MIRDLINSAGGRGFVFAVIAFLFTAAFAIWDGMTWDTWLDYNKAIGLGFLGAKAIEETARKLTGGDK